jgi:quercetin dioxygenase-like cupin family protein
MSKTQEFIIDTEKVRVRVMPLAPGQSTDWHYHTEVTDTMVCLEGQLAIAMKEPEEVIHLKPGQMHQVLPGRVHQVSNPGTGESKYLLIQGVGKYDFITSIK